MNGSYYTENNLVSINLVTRDAVKLFKNSNSFLDNLNWDEVFDVMSTKSMSLQQAMLLGTVAIIIKNPVVSRRFWSG